MKTGRTLTCKQGQRCCPEKRSAGRVYKPAHDPSFLMGFCPAPSLGHLVRKTPGRPETEENGEVFIQGNTYS